MTTKFASTFNDYEKVSLWRTRWARHLRNIMSNSHDIKSNNKKYLKSERNYVWIGDGKN